MTEVEEAFAEEPIALADGLYVLTFASVEEVAYHGWPKWLWLFTLAEAPHPIRVLSNRPQRPPPEEGNAPVRLFTTKTFHLCRVLGATAFSTRALRAARMRGRLVGAVNAKGRHMMNLAEWWSLDGKLHAVTLRAGQKYARDGSVAVSDRRKPSDEEF